MTNANMNFKNVYIHFVLFSKLVSAYTTKAFYVHFLSKYLRRNGVLSDLLVIVA